MYLYTHTHFNREKQRKQRTTTTGEVVWPAPNGCYLAIQIGELSSRPVSQQQMQMRMGSVNAFDASDDIHYGFCSFFCFLSLPNTHIYVCLCEWHHHQATKCRRDNRCIYVLKGARVLIYYTHRQEVLLFEIANELGTTD